MDRSPVGPLHLERGTLANGVEVVRQEPPAGSASFAVTVVTPSGWGYESAPQGGLALLASELAPTGAGRLRYVELAQELDRRGATLTSDCHPESSEINLWGPAGQMTPLLPLLVDALLRPRFDPVEIARVRRQVVERQLRERTQPDRVAEKELFRRIYPPGHPYRETGLGSRRSIAAIDRAQLVRFHSTHATPRGSVVIATCHERLTEIARKLDTVFTGWDASAGPGEPELRGPVRPASDAISLNVPGGSQVEIRVGGPTVTRKDPAYLAVLLANELLGGRSVLARLFQNLREKRGLVYHAASTVEGMRWGGYWTAQAGADRAKSAQVLKLLRAEVGRLSEESPSASELDRIRESLIGSIVLELETTASAHELATEIGYYGLSTDYYAELPEALRAVTPAQVQEAARRYLAVDRSATVLAGPLGRGAV